MADTTGTISCSFKKLDVTLNTFRAPSRFKGSSSAAWADLLTQRTRWTWDLYGVTPKTLLCTFEEYPEDIEVFFIDTGERTGDIDCDHDQAVYDLYDTVELFTGTYNDPVQEINGDVDCALEQWGMQSHSGLHMDLTMQLWDFQSYFNIEGEDMDNMVFEELRFEAYAMVDLVTLELETQRWQCEMGDAPEVNLHFERFIFAGEGSPGFTARVDASFQRFNAAMTAGVPYNVDCEAEELTFSATGDTPIRSTINLDMRIFQAEITATTPWSAAMDLRGGQWRFDGSSDSALAPRGDLELTFRQLQITGEVDSGKVADIDSIFRDLLFRATANTDGNNDLDLTTPEPEIEMGSGGAMSGETCAVADDLTFEEVL